MKELFEKVARNEHLNPQELSEFVSFAERLQGVEALISGMVIPGTSSLSLERPVISNPQWETDPLHTLYVFRNTNVSVANSTDYAIQFEGFEGEQQHFEWYSAQPTRLYVKNLAKKIPLTVKGIVAWTVNDVGYRNAKLNAYDGDNVFLGSAVLFSLDAVGSTDSVFPICYPFTFIADFPTISYLTVTTAQTSGGNLQMNYANIAISAG